MMRRVPLPEPGLDGLRMAIIRQAIFDYDTAVKFSRQGIAGTDRDSLEKERWKRDCKEFFLGAWFAKICRLDGADIIRRIENGEVL